MQELALIIDSILDAKDAKIIVDEYYKKSTEETLALVSRSIHDAVDNGKYHVFVKGILDDSIIEVLKRKGYTIEFDDDHGYDNYTVIKWR